MPIQIPTLQELRDRIKNDIESRLSVTLPTYGKNFLVTWVGVQAAKLRLIYNLIHFVNENITPDTAVSESLGGTLDRWGRIKLGRNMFQATNGVYEMDVSGTIGSVINAGQTFRSKDGSTSSNKLFVVDNQVTLDVSPKTIQVRSLETGIDSILVIGDELLQSSPIVGIDSLSTISSVLDTPLDAEDVEDFRDKIVESFRIEPQGGAVGDFRIWAADEQGVRTVYPYAKDGESGAIDIYVEASESDSIDGNGTPSDDLIDSLDSEQGVLWLDPDVNIDINDRGRMPLTVLNSYILKVTPLKVEVTIDGFVGLTTDIEDSILTALKATLKNVRPYIAGADVFADKNDILSINSLSFAVIDTIPSNTYFGTLSMTISGNSQSTFTFDKGNIPYIENINFN